MAEPTKESTLVNRIRSAILERHPAAVIYKIHGSPVQEAGIPDLLVIVEGRVVGLEVKLQRPSESPEAARRRATPAQLRQLGRIRRAGGGGAVVLSIEEALDEIHRHLESPNPPPA